MTEISVSSRAYCKISLHCAKYPHCAVNGVLLAASDQVSSRNILYTDAIPLFHLCLQLAPMIEIALTQIEMWAESVGLIIAGYYFANENLDDQSIDRCVYRIADKIGDIFTYPCIALVDNRLITSDQQTSALKLSQCVDKKWKSLDKSSVIVMPETLEKASALLQQGAYEKLIDFDNHLDNISLDWRNFCLNTEIDEIVVLPSYAESSSSSSSLDT